MPFSTIKRYLSARVGTAADGSPIEAANPCPDDLAAGSRRVAIPVGRGPGRRPIFATGDCKTDRVEANARYIGRNVGRAPDGKPIYSVPCVKCNQLPPGTCGCCYFQPGDTVTLSCAGCNPESQPGWYSPAPYFRCTNFPGAIRAEFYHYFSLPQFPQWWHWIEIKLMCHSYNQVTLEYLRLGSSSACYDHIGHQNCSGDYVYEPGGFRDCGSIATTSSCDPLMIEIPHLHYKCCMNQFCVGPYTLTR